MMGGNQVRAAIDRLGLTQVGLAHLFGVNDVTVRRWVARGTHGPVVILLRLALKKKISLKDIAKART